MQLKKEILLFYVLLLASAGVIIAADDPFFEQPQPPVPAKCSKLPHPQPPARPFNNITETIWRYRA